MGILRSSRPLGGLRAALFFWRFGRMRDKPGEMTKAIWARLMSRRATFAEREEALAVRAKIKAKHPDIDERLPNGHSMPSISARQSWASQEGSPQGDTGDGRRYSRARARR